MKITYFTTKNLVISAAIAGLYAAITLLFQPLSFGPFQFRISEALTLLPIIFPQSVLGLSLGCFIANLLASPTPWDILFGTLATLFAALATYRLRNKKLWIAALPPVIFNAVIIGFVLSFTGNAGNSGLLATMGSVGLGQGVVCYALGIPLVLALKKLPSQWYH